MFLINFGKIKLFGRSFASVFLILCLWFFVFNVFFFHSLFYFLILWSEGGGWIKLISIIREGGRNKKSKCCVCLCGIHISLFSENGGRVYSVTNLCITPPPLLECRMWCSLFSIFFSPSLQFWVDYFINFLWSFPRGEGGYCGCWFDDWWVVEGGKWEKGRWREEMIVNAFFLSFLIFSCSSVSIWWICFNFDCGFTIDKRESFTHVSISNVIHHTHLNNRKKRRICWIDWEDLQDEIFGMDWMELQYSIESGDSRLWWCSSGEWVGDLGN